MIQKIALVTGGTRGIGAAISQSLLNDGYKVIANYADNDERAIKFAQNTGAIIKKFDVSDFDSVCKAVTEIQAEHGFIDVLVNNAGITRDGFFHKMTPQQWKEVLSTNLDSMFNVSRPIFETMRNRGTGRIINISSINGQKGQAGQTNYSAAKAGVIGFTKALAQEAAHKGVTVNCICPGYINTEMVSGINENVLKSIVSNIPAGRLGEADEIGALVRYIASDEAGFMNGSVQSINGAQYCA
jgi:acetoacetyl-CoA reductase